MELNFKPFSSKYCEESKELLFQSFDFNPPLKLLEKDKVMLCFVDEKLVGLCAFQTNELHGSTIVEHICVHPKFRRKSIGRRLHAKALSSLPLARSDLYLDMGCDSEDVQARKFIKSLGFKKYLASRMHIFESEAVWKVESQNKINSLLEFYKTAGAKEGLRSFYIKRYCEEHKVNVPVTADDKVWEDYYQDGDDQSYGAVLTKNSRIIGCSFVSLNFESSFFNFAPKDLACLNGYAFGASASEEAENLKTLYSHQINSLKNVGYNNFYIEVDSTERIANEMGSWLPQPIKTLERYQLAISP